MLRPVPQIILFALRRQFTVELQVDNTDEAFRWLRRWLAFQPYARRARLAAKLVAPGGWLVLCSCSHAADPENFNRANTRGLARAGRRAALVHSGRAGPDHPSHVALPETSYLKALFYRLDG